MKIQSKHFVGYWHYGVILTYLSLTLAIVGMCFATAAGGDRRPDIAAFLLLMSGLCDAFDGMVAKTRKNRTNDDKAFGIQIDSLCDMVSFGIAPIMIGIGMGMTRWYYVIIYAMFVLCGLIRLGYYNVSEGNRLYSGEEGPRDAYEGLPITNASLAMPVFYLIATMFDSTGNLGLTAHQALIVESVIMMVGYGLCAFLFIFKFRMPKAHARGLAITCIAITVIVISLALVRYYVCGVVLFAPLTRYGV